MKKRDDGCVLTWRYIARQGAVSGTAVSTKEYLKLWPLLQNKQHFYPVTGFFASVSFGNDGTNRGRQGLINMPLQVRHYYHIDMQNISKVFKQSIFIIIGLSLY
ncbi:hypothetical protein [Methylovorus sp. MP688]|uniref:hypothetical protein n=1 Tax=Methylovorus sp. (strain MP688) TaxID=887061 RepID=UPI0011D0C49D|nr:hypothetical protein [Methylovorus sp. MP688]